MVEYIKYKSGEKYFEFEEGSPVIGNNINDFEDAGRIINEREIVIDIDSVDKEKLRNIFKELKIVTETIETTRGFHLIFKKPKYFRKKLPAEAVCSLGFKVEYKTKKNATSSTTIKQNGNERYREHQGVVADIPDYFLPLKGGIDFISLDDNDSWHMKLYEHRCRVVNTGIDNATEIIKAINEYIFDTPLAVNRLAGILRGDVENGHDLKRGDSCEMAKIFIKKYKVNKYIGILYYWNEKAGTYQNDYDELLRFIQLEFDNLGLQVKDIMEIYKLMSIQLVNVKTNKDFVIKLKNGFLKNGKFFDIPYSEFTPYTINVNYYPDKAVNEDVDNYLNHLCQSDKNYKDFICEALSHGLIVDTEFKRMLGKFFIFVGGGGNGKGTLLEIIRGIYNNENVSAVKINKLHDDRFLYDLKGKLINLGDDISKEAINHEQMEILKNISTCDEVNTRALYSMGEKTTFTTTLIFTSNHVLKSFEKGDSYKRRVYWCPMYSKVTEDKKDPLFISKLTSQDATEYWIKLLIDGYIRLYSKMNFTQSDIIDDFNNNYHETNNSTVAFINEALNDDINAVLDKTGPELYEEFKCWFDENDSGDTTLSSKSLFKETICDHFKVDIKPVTRDKRTSRIYIKIK